MDRLSALIALIGCGLVLLLAACDDAAASKAPAGEAAGRVNAVMATGKQQSFADLCDVAPDKAAPKAFSWPPLVQSAPASSARYRWVNIWATWCKPCVEEMPLLRRVFDDWRKQGHDVALTLVSVDADPSAVKSFTGQHPDTPSTLQVSDATQTTSWLTSLGLATGSAIPVHMVVDAQNNLLCARSGGIAQEDLDRFRKVMFP